jgi:hypothetical protein
MTERNNIVVAVYASHSEAEEAVRGLQRAGIDMSSLSIVAKGAHTEEHVLGYYNSGDRMKYWGRTGAFWGGIWGLLTGSALFALPGIGPVLVGGPLTLSVVGALEGAVMLGGLSAIGAGLYGMGIPKDSVIEYETAIKADRYLLVVHGTASETAKTRYLLDSTRHITMSLHEAKQIAASVI